MQFKLTIDTDNAAFHDPDTDAPDPSELARLLHEIADQVQSPHGHTRSILDVNGNRVGSWKWWKED